jgi:hypothetical protein
MESSIFQAVLQKLKELSLDSHMLDLLIALNSVGSQGTQDGDVLEVELEHDSDDPQVLLLLAHRVEVCLFGFYSQEGLETCECDVVAHSFLLHFKKRIKPLFVESYF